MTIYSESYPLLGAIAGDIIGSPYELKGNRIKTTDFFMFSEKSRFTDDTVLSLAVAKWVLDPSKNLSEIMVNLGRKFMSVGYGHAFKTWMRSDEQKPYGSYGNGSAMRVSSIGSHAKSLSQALELAKRSAEITHNHPEGIKGAQAVAAAVFLAFHGYSKAKIKKYLERKFKYKLERSIDSIRENYDFDSSCQGSVPEAIIAFLESRDFEDAVRLAVSLGGDADTQASIAGAISAAYYKEIPQRIIDKSLELIETDDDSGELGRIFAKFNSAHKAPEREFILIAPKDIEVNCLMRYTFALAVTDSTKVLLPKGTVLSVDKNKQERVYYCNIIKGKSEVFEWIEKDLGRRYPQVNKFEYPELCNGICIRIPFGKISDFTVEYTDEMSTKRKEWLFKLYTELQMLI